MAAIWGAVIAAGASLTGAGIQAWSSLYAGDKALDEHRRAEKLRIKFAKEESKREEERFRRTHQLQTESQNFNATQTVLNNIQGMFQSNRALTRQMMNFNRSRA